MQPCKAIAIVVAKNKPLPNNIFTIYGRNAVFEALQDSSLDVFRLHLSESNKPAKVIDQCIRIAEDRNIEVLYHDKRKLSFISKNSKQDQGVALDIQAHRFLSIDDLNPAKHKNVLLLDNITTPQNVGMIIRSAAAGHIDAIVIPKKGAADLGPLVIKASAGAIFKAPILRCDSAINAARQLMKDYRLISLSLDSKQNFFDFEANKASIFILGNESTGVSKELNALCHETYKIPMNNEVESLNVAVTASLIAFHPAFVKRL